MSEKKKDEDYHEHQDGCDFGVHRNRLKSEMSSSRQQLKKDTGRERSFCVFGIIYHSAESDLCDHVSQALMRVLLLLKMCIRENICKSDLFTLSKIFGFMQMELMVLHLVQR